MIRYLINAAIKKRGRERKENRLTELDRLNEEIVRELRKLNAMSRRGRPEVPEGEVRREHGRGRSMGILADRGPMSQAKLAEYLDIRPQSLSEVICKMESDGIVMRRQSEEDRRQTIVSLTEAGVARVEAFREFQRRHAEEFLAPLSIEERKMFASLLARLTGPREKDGGAEDDREEKPDGAVNSDGNTGRCER